MFAVSEMLETISHTEVEADEVGWGKVRISKKKKRNNIYIHIFFCETELRVCAQAS